ncbi:MAG: hypothetical protein A2798_00695 [Candidatus Levybacteria bacterium RIFCSPHIGHO2_01_FULL_37_17]|nr:MAG: hypothetical protein A2798_00695 [Candidatus Levybacteria bacterium RIFCSPHIGHO2_01_FULL_37_17]OGH36972.1 MAG: hypothetical protein A2959_01555 [Candidatus Levybacteria bacterium RIFCSPLOWO2_01_FULL_38_23]
MVERPEQQAKPEPRTSEEVQTAIPLLIESVQKRFFPVDDLEIGLIRFRKDGSHYVIELKNQNGKRRLQIKEQTPDYTTQDTIIDENSEIFGVPFIASYQFLDNLYKHYNSKNSLRRAKALVRKLQI